MCATPSSRKGCRGCSTRGVARHGRLTSHAVNTLLTRSSHVIRRLLMICWPQRLRMTWRGGPEPRPFESSALQLAPSLAVGPSPPLPSTERRSVAVPPRAWGTALTQPRPWTTLLMTSIPTGTLRAHRSACSTRPSQRLYGATLEMGARAAALSSCARSRSRRGRRSAATMPRAARRAEPNSGSPLGENTSAREVERWSIARRETGMQSSGGA